MKRKVTAVILTLLFLAGLAVLLYPTVSDYMAEKYAARLVTDYDRFLETGEKENFEAVFQEAEQYNQQLLQYPNLNLAAAGELERQEQGDNPYDRILDASGTGIMGIINIPSVNILLPVYHGTEEGVLQAAAGHYLGSSLPIGGKGTHAIITGHRGLPSAKLFTDLDRLETGDLFYLKILDRILEYRIDQIETVLPEELDSLSIDPEQDYVTLVTCTPYGINSHRLLLRGVRVDYDGNYREPVPEKPLPARVRSEGEPQTGRELPFGFWMVTAAGLCIAAVLLGIWSGKHGTEKKGKTWKEKKGEGHDQNE